MVNQDKNSKMQFMVLNSSSDQRSQIAKHINIILNSKPEDKFIVQAITDFNNVIDGESCMGSFTKDELINLIELISVE